MNKIGIDGQVMFRWQAAVSFSLATGAFTNTLTVRAKPGYKDDYTDYCYNSPTGYDGNLGCGPDNGNRRVSAYTTFDWQTKYDINKVFAVTAGIRNLFDRNPPFTINDQAGTSNARGYDGRYADPLGRTFYASASYKF
jgi:iron complex outermembrane receptor protein